MLLRGSGLKKNARVSSNQSSLCFQSGMKLVLIYRPLPHSDASDGQTEGEVRPEEASRLFRNSRIWNEDSGRKVGKDGRKEAVREREGGGRREGQCFFQDLKVLVLNSQGS